MKQTVIITGASKGIGLALSKSLLNKDYYVIGSSRKGYIKSISHQNFESFQLDLSKKESISQFVNKLKAKKIRIDLLINNAGIGPDLDKKELIEKFFDETFEVNVKGLVFLTESILPIIKKGGKILNVSSKMGSIDYCQLFDSPAYRMSKSALNMYTKILSNRLINIIKVAAIHPGWVQTTISESNVNARLTSEESADKIIQYIETRFENGDFWDAERNLKLMW